MKNAAVLTAIAFLAATALSGTALAADAMKGQKQGQSQMQSGQAGSQQIRTASDLQKFEVQTAQGEKLGKVDKVAIDMQQGQIAYVSLSGQGMENVIVPWKALKAQPQQQTLVLSKSNITADMLKQQAPKGDLQQLSRQQGQQIHQFYGVSPYWEAGQSGQPGQRPGSQQQMERGTMMDPERSQQQQRQPMQPGRGM